MILHNACPVCNGREAEKLGELVYALPENSPISHTLTVCACLKCGFVVSDTESSQADYDRYYTLGNYSPSYIEKKPAPEEQRYFEESSKIIVSHLGSKSDVIFDIGCGLGYLIEELDALGCKNIFGVDPSVECVETIVQKGFQAEVGSLANVPVNTHQPQFISVYHIVEHLISVVQQIKGLHNRLAGGGKVMVEVPDTTLIPDYCNGKPLSYLYYTHVLHFDDVQLKNLFESNGFKEIDNGKRVRDEKELQMPCIWSVFEKSETVEPCFTPDFKLASLIKNWFNETGLDPEGKVQKLAQSKKSVYIWGIGIHAHQMLGMSVLKDCNIKALVDKNITLIGTKVGQWEIKSSELLKDATEQDVVFITALVHREKMCDFLRNEYGFNGEIVTI